MKGSPHTLLGLYGPTGSGKSTLGKLIAKKMRARFIAEPIPKRVGDSGRLDGFAIQREILSAKRDALARPTRFNLTILDRTIAEDREVFFPLHRQLGNLSDVEVEALNVWSKQLEVEVGTPSAVIVIHARKADLVNRMVADGRPAWVVDSLPIQLSLYDKMPMPIGVPYVDIDSSELSLRDLSAVADWVAETRAGNSPCPLNLGGQQTLNWTLPAPHQTPR